jgi:hypothetical protein
VPLFSSSAFAPLVLITGLLMTAVSPFSRDARVEAIRAAYNTLQEAEAYRAWMNIEAARTRP